MKGLRDSTTTQLFWQRWWILGIFSLFTMWGCAVWNTWAPIADTAKKESKKLTNQNKFYKFNPRSDIWLE